MGLLQGRTAIVTGASSGIGRAIALRFAAEGARLSLADLRETPVEGGEATLELIRRAGGEAFSLAVDVARWEDVDRLVGETVRRHGRLDIMVNNAATYTGTSLLDTTEAQWSRVMSVNVTGLFFGCKRAVQQMLAQTPRGEVRGRIVNITSQHGMVGVPGHFAYAVGKGGLVQLTRQIAVEHGRDGIICNAVAPGKILTGAAGDLAADPVSAAYVRSRTPFGRLGQPADVAAAVAFLASDQASYISGVNLMVDGGWMAY